MSAGFLKFKLTNAKIKYFNFVDKEKRTSSF